MHRRHFLHLAGRATASIILLGGLESTLSGCATTTPRSQHAHTESYHELVHSTISDPHNYTRFLQPGEYVVPDEVFEAYVSVVDPRAATMGTPIGGYMKRSFLDTKKKQKEFTDTLRNRFLDNEALRQYVKLFTSPNMIVLKESALSNELFEKILPHERFHKHLNNLGKAEYQHMMAVAKQLLDTQNDTGKALVREKEDSRFRGGFAVMYAHTNTEEFYTYLAQGEFDPEVEEILRTEHTDIYNTFSRIKEECKLE